MNAKKKVRNVAGRPSLAGAQRLAVALLAVATLALTGCGKSGPPEKLAVFPVEGKIELNGKPPAGATVILHPKNEALTPGARAEVQPDGTFKATTYTTGDGAAEGDYIVTVEWRKAVQKNGDYTFGPNLVPEQYSDRKTSQLEVHVAEQPNVLRPIKLKR